METDKIMEDAINDILTVTPDAEPTDTSTVTDPVVPPADEPPVIPPVEPPAVDAPPVPPVDEPPVVPPTPPVEPAVPVVPATPAPPRDARDTELESLRNTIAELRKGMETLASQNINQPSTPPASAPADQVISFVEKEEDLDALLNSKDNFNKFMTGALGKSNEQVMQAMTVVVPKLVDQIVTQRLAVNEFYTNNKDLSSNKAYVGIVANELAKAHPDWDTLTVISNLAEEVRRRLGLGGTVPNQPPVAPSVDAPPMDSPAFVPGAGARTGTGPSSMTQKEKAIIDLISDIV